MKEKARVGTHKIVKDIFVKLGLDTSKPILDAGCGQGILLDWLHSHGYKYLYGCDIKPCVGKFEFKRVDLNQCIPYTDNKFSTMFSVQNLEHLENHKYFFREAHRVLNENGYLILSVPNPTTWYARLYFLFTGRFLDFERNGYRGVGHINPTFHYLLSLHYDDLFELIEVRHNYGLIPLTGIKFPASSSLFSSGYALLLKVKNKQQILGE